MNNTAVNNHVQEFGGTYISVILGIEVGSGIAGLRNCQIVF